MLPEDKASVVKLLKENFNKKGLVLSCGATLEDIPMFRESDIGVTTRSNRENYVVNFSEVSINNFYDMKDLILLHGYTSYIRMSLVIRLFLYISLISVLTNFLYMTVNDYSG